MFLGIQSPSDCESVKSRGALVTQDNLAEFTALSQKGFARSPRELLVVAKGPDNVTAFLVSFEQLRGGQARAAERLNLMEDRIFPAGRIQGTLMLTVDLPCS